MSVINQMLRELDARKSGAEHMHAAFVPSRRQFRVHPKFFYPGAIAMAVLVLILVGALAWRGHEPAQEVVTSMNHAGDDAMADLPAPPTEERHIADGKLPAPVGKRSTPSHGQTEPAASAVPQAALVVPMPVNSIAAQVSPEIKTAAEPDAETEARQLFAHAEQARRAGDGELAKARYRLALQRKPAFVDAAIALAALLRDAGENEAAYRVLETSYTHARSPGVAVAAGRLLADSNRDAEALVWLERGGDGLRPADHALRGALYARLNQHDRAIASYQQALSLEPGQGGWLLGLGLSLEANGRIAEAREVFGQALTHGVFNADVVKFLQDKLQKNQIR